MLHIIGIIIVGFIIGLVARALHPGDDRMGFVLTTVLGIAGSIIAGYGTRFVGLRLDTLGMFMAAVIGSIILIVVVGFVRRAAR